MIKLYCNEGVKMMGSILVGLLMGAIGMAYFIYGKKTTEFSFLIFGAVLIVYPYFVSNAVLSMVLGIIFILCPFIIKRYF
jgi:hypothetical protein